jgi:hypothetical protein
LELFPFFLFDLPPFLFLSSLPFFREVTAI